MVKGIIQRLPLFVTDQATEQRVVEGSNGPGEVVAIVVFVDGPHSMPAQRNIGGLDHHRQVVEKSAVPVPNHMKASHEAAH